MEKPLAASFPNAVDADRIRSLFAADLEHDRLGIEVRMDDGEIHFSVPILVVAGQKPA